MIDVGKKAPSFSLSDKDGKKISLKDVDASYTVVYFYPKDNAPGCTIEAHGFEKLKTKFKNANAVVVGISGGDEKSKTKFCEKQNLSILLLSDSDFAVSTKYGVYGEKKFMGKTYMGINRVTFLLDKDKKVIKRYDSVKPLTHPQNVLDDITSF
ncbi:thioredoxin-dependent thiol peroxidase [Candidatus Woesearchaeota archaeon]|nr:thioredoxin-dependent thiol peroxidase [Candidatus Woesearchaeota archaeon]